MQKEQRDIFMADIKKIIAEHLRIEESKITPEAEIEKDLGGDSLDQIEFLMAAEEHFGILISDEEAERLKNVGDIHAFICRKVEHLAAA